MRCTSRDLGCGSALGAWPRRGAPVGRGGPGGTPRACDLRTAFGATAEARSSHPSVDRDGLPGAPERQRCPRSRTQRNSPGRPSSAGESSHVRRIVGKRPRWDTHPMVAAASEGTSGRPASASTRLGCLSYEHCPPPSGVDEVQPITEQGDLSGTRKGRECQTAAVEPAGVRRRGSLALASVGPAEDDMPRRVHDQDRRERSPR